MAYGNNADEIKPIIQTKMNNMNSPDHSLNSIVGPLKNLKQELDTSRQLNLLRSVRRIDDENVNITFNLKIYYYKYFFI